jgi:hypothetical protein
MPALRRDCQFPVADDSDAPMHAGQAFERRVIDELKGKGKR